jgi:3'-phosphoadenosine 5'-phosphosulfate sulfotransferase (PAPS reductase)/FAD synthetase
MLDDLPQERLLQVQSESAIARLLQAGHPLLIAYSGGKDSTAVLTLALNAARELKRAGHSVPRIIITHGDTGIENPLVEALAEREMQKARDFGRAHGIDVVAEVARPSLNDSWAVSILSGRRLPTFSNASSRDCTVNWKITPMVRLRKRLLAVAPGQDAARPVTLIGTRFDESDGRAARMRERGESALEPWEKDGALYLSPIADWTSDDVWGFLGELRSGQLEGFSDSAEIFDLYAQAGGTSCAVVADMATEGAKKSRACGARFGCALCTAVGRDRSLENMLESDNSLAWLRPLNALQRFLVDTQYDLRRRSWLGRTIDAEGFVKVYPDTYSFGMLSELLRYALTIDVIEARESRAAGLFSPRFQLVSPEALIAIDAQWSLQGIADRPYAAIAIWREVYLQGKRFFPPVGLKFEQKPFPAPRYLYVGEDWENGRRSQYGGMRDALLDLARFDGDTGHRVLKDGRVILSMESSALFSIDPEGAMMFLDWEAEDALAQHYDQRGASGARAFFHYVELGLLETSTKHQSVIDAMMRRAAWKRRNGLAGDVSLDQLLAQSICATEKAIHVTNPLLSSTGPERPLTARERLCEPAFL